MLPATNVVGIHKEIIAMDEINGIFFSAPGLENGNRRDSRFLRFGGTSIPKKISAKSIPVRSCAIFILEFNEDIVYAFGKVRLLHVDMRNLS